jgi:hypothetical protein
LPRMGERCLSKMAVNFSSASTRANWKSTRAASHWKIALAIPVDMVATDGTEEGRFNAVRQMGRWKQGRQGRRRNKKSKRLRLSLAKTLSDEAGPGMRVFRAGVVRSSNGGPSGEGAERLFASRRESTRSTPPVGPAIFDP